MKFRIVPAVAIVASLGLGGCAVYGPPPGYGQGGYYGAQPVYAQPAPVYIGPPVSIGLGFGFWGHRHRHRR